ncbi:MAG: glycosyltransferase family 39 protein, partial [Thermoguttaceae bacterium]
MRSIGRRKTPHPNPLPQGERGPVADNAEVILRPSPRRIRAGVAWALLLLAVLFSVVVRWRLREFPLERDEGEFAYAGQLILENVPPYQLAYNMKLPGTYLAYAALMAVLGQTTAGIHLGLLAVNVATLVLLFLMVSDMFDPLTGGLAAVALSLLAMSSSVLGMAAHATHFVVLFSLPGVWLLWKAVQSGKRGPLLAAGLLMGIAFLMKQQGVFLLCFGGCVLMAYELRRRPIVWRQLLSRAALYAAGVMMPYGLVCLWLWRAGVFGRFWFWTVAYARQYVDQIPLSLAWQAFRMNAAGVIAPSWTLWALAAVGGIVVAIG